jgi:hypothetical protein
MGIRPQRPMAALVLFYLVAFGGMGRLAYGGILDFDGENNPNPLIFPSGLARDNTSLTLTERITFGPVFGQVPFFDLGLIVTNSDAKNIFAFTGVVNNSTGTSWTDYHFQLGSGFGANFVLGATNPGIDFLGSPIPTSDVFSILGQVTDALSWSVGPLPSGGVVNFGFSFTVPDADVPGAAGFQFTLRQFPTVPEPSSLLLLASGLAALAGFAQRLAKRK